MVNCDVLGSRRHDDDGGSQGPIVIPLGLMLLALCFVALVFHRLKQSNIIACILIGTFVGGSGLGDSVSRELTAAFIELGIILVLFMGGLEVDVAGCIKRWKLVLLNGLGQIVITLAVFCAIGIATGLTSEAVDTIFFALAMTMSSTILVLTALKDRQEMETVHGQVILGLCVLQDTTSVVSLLVLSSFDPDKADGPSFGVSIGIMIGKFVACIAILVFLAKYVLAWWFKMFAVSGEMLFVGTVGYAFGVAALAGLADFSPEIGGFFAGVSLSSVPYRLEIEHKVEPIKAFGVVLFFFMLGIDLQMDLESLKAALPWATLLAGLTVFVFPTIMWLLGYLSRFRGRTAFMIGIVINQISEFSLILSQLAHKYEVFTAKQFQVITFATVISLLFSSICHVRADEIYDKIGWMLERLDRRTTEEDKAEEEFVMEDHVVLLGFNETGLEIAEFYRHNNQDVLVIQLDPALHSTFKKGYIKPDLRPQFDPLHPDDDDDEHDDDDDEEDAHITAHAAHQGLKKEGSEFDLEGWAYRRASSSPDDSSTNNVLGATPKLEVELVPTAAAASGAVLPVARARPCSADRPPPKTQLQAGGGGGGRRSLDLVRPRLSVDGLGPVPKMQMQVQVRGRRSLDLARPPPRYSMEGAGWKSRRSMEDTSAPAGKARANLNAPRARRSLDQVRPSKSALAAARGTASGGSNGAGRQSLDLQRRAPAVTFTDDAQGSKGAGEKEKEKGKENLNVSMTGSVDEQGRALPGVWMTEEIQAQLDRAFNTPVGVGAGAAARAQNGGGGSEQQRDAERGRMPPRTEPSAAPAAWNAKHDGINFSARKMRGKLNGNGNGNGACGAEAEAAAGRRVSAEDLADTGLSEAAAGQLGALRQRQGRSMEQSFRDASRVDVERAPKEGMATNIFSVYADPEKPATWEHYQLNKAKIVFSCMVGGQAAEVYLSRMLKKEGVPFLAICESSGEAKELYDAGCRYVIQQEYLAARVMKEILDDEIPKGQQLAFHAKRDEHRAELQDNTEDELVHRIHSFL